MIELRSGKSYIWKCDNLRILISLRINPYVYCHIFIAFLKIN